MKTRIKLDGKVYDAERYPKFYKWSKKPVWDLELTEVKDRRFKVDKK